MAGATVGSVLIAGTVGVAVVGPETAAVALTAVRSVAIGSTVSGLVGGAVDASKQALTSPNHTVNLGAVGRAGTNSMETGAASGTGNRIFGIPGAMVGAAAATKEQGGNNYEAAAAAIGAGLGNLIAPTPQGAGLGATIGRAFVRSFIGQASTQTNKQLEPKSTSGNCPSGGQSSCPK